MADTTLNLKIVDGGLVISEHGTVANFTPAASLLSSNQVLLYSQDVGGVSKGYIMDSDGRATELTNPSSVSTKTTNYTVQSGDYTVLANASGIVISLPDPTLHSGSVFNIKRINSAGNVTVSGYVGATSTGLLDGSSSALLTGQYSALVAQSSGPNWLALSRYL